MNLRNWLELGPYTLALSSGYFGFFAHFGVLAALEKHNLLPNKISGSSAGALAGACWASGCPMANIRSELVRLSKHDFWDPAIGFGLLKGRRFREFVQNVCPVFAIEDCLLPLSISAFDLRSASTHVFNRGSLSDSVYASCTVPLLFQPICIDNGLYFDGGIKDAPGLAGTKNGERILLHHLESQFQPLFRRVKGANRPPSRQNLVSVVIDNLAPAGPSRLHNGPLAFQQAETGLERALEKPLNPDGIIV